MYRPPGPAGSLPIINTGYQGTCAHLTEKALGAAVGGGLPAEGRAQHVTRVRHGQLPTRRLDRARGLPLGRNRCQMTFITYTSHMEQLPSQPDFGSSVLTNCAGFSRGYVPPVRQSHLPFRCPHSFFAR
eukprot:3222168-Prymnesium_polylepis.2